MNFWISLIYIGFLTSLINGQAEVKIEILNNSTCSTPAREGIAKLKPTQHELSVPRGYYPWHTAIFGRAIGTIEYICGGTLISSGTVLTAAQCVHDGVELLAARSVLVKFDVTQLYVDGTAHRIKKITVHENFNQDNFKHDIAVLKLRTKVTFTDFIRPACLTNENFNIFDVVGDVVGFGQSVELHAVSMPGRTFEECKVNNERFYDNYVNQDYNFCAGYVNGTTMSRGDSGGGLFFNHSNIFYVRGIVSLAASDSRGIIDPTKYVLFTDIQKHYKWIVDQMDESERN